MKNFILGVFAGVLFFVLGAMAYLQLGLAEVRADLPPSKFETRFMTASVHASVRRQAPEATNPVPLSDENLVGGGKLYANNCAGCHGNLGGSEDIGDSLFPPIPQFAKVGTTYTEAQIFWVTKHGIRRAGMFANGKWNNDKDLWTMAAFVKRIRELPPGVRSALASKTESAK
jgi:mono/diheme cytochrome c family protein